MRRRVWPRVVRFAISLGSTIIFVVLVVNGGAGGGGFAGIGALKFNEIPGQSNLPTETGQIEVDRVGSVHLDYATGDISHGVVRHLLGPPGEAELLWNRKDVLEASFQESKFQGEVMWPQDLSPVIGNGMPVQRGTEKSSCTNVRQHPGFTDSCSYARAVPECSSGTLIEYTRIFYCFFSGSPILAYIALTFWLFSLFYTLGNTAADFFCSSIKNLKTLLHLPPTLAGVTLLPFGNGAPDVFASIAAFVGASGQGQVGLNSALGGAMFVSSVVAGSIALVMMVPVQLDRKCFLRDIGFFFLVLTALTVILFVGKIGFWTSIGYTSIYILYAITVALVEYLRSTGGLNQTLLEPLLSGPPAENGNNDVGRASADEPSLPQWRWAPHVDIYRQESVAGRQLWGDDELEDDDVKWYTARGIFSYFIHWPLTIPRRLTIPLVENDGWSKFYAVCSATLAPLLVAMVWDGTDNGPFGSAWMEYLVAGGVGILLGGLSLLFLREDRPPRRYRLLWAAGGFIMSMVWFYIIAIELVAALVALGAVLEIDPAILGLTVLAWGNSVGDLMSNLALVSHGNDGVQIAFSGCYAGPMFNTLIGVGVSFILASWKTYPDALVIPEDNSIFITLAFLVVGLLWALLTMLSRNMEPTKGFGIGLLILYAAFLTSRLAYALDVQSILFSAGRW